MSFDPIQYKTTTRQQWEDAAEAWDQWEPVLEAWLGEATNRMLQAAGIRAGTEVLDVRGMVVLGFKKRVVALFYIVAVGLLSVHLLHGADSLFQTFGWRSHRWERALRAVVALFCAAYFLGNLSIPGAALLGYLH